MVPNMGRLCSIHILVLLVAFQHIVSVLVQLGTWKGASPGPCET